MKVYYNDNNPNSVKFLQRLMNKGLIPDGDIDDRSILDVMPNDIKDYNQCHFFAGIGGWLKALELAGWPEDLEVWTGSPPCQPFSSAGLQKGKDDDRHLAPHFAELVSARQPMFLFGEQVATPQTLGPTTTSSKQHTDDEVQWCWLDDLFSQLEGSHYACAASDIPASGVGAPHIRQRTFFGAVAHSKWDKQPRKKPCSWKTGRVGRKQQPVPWDTSWETALAKFRALDDGLPRNVGATDAARNAIVPQVGATFIEAFMDSLHDTDTFTLELEGRSL